MKKLIPLTLTAALLLSLFFTFAYSGNIGKKAAEGAGTEYASPAENGTQAKLFWLLSDKQVVEKIGSLCQEDMQRSGILASVSAAQFILESAYGISELAQEANNCFGMKCSLSGNTWEGSTWDGVSSYTMETEEEYTEGTFTVITAEFRKYSCVEDSVEDHSVYLLSAMDGGRKRYEGISGEADYRKAAQIIKDGGYATASDYAEMLCSVIERYDLTRFDQAAMPPFFLLN